MPSIGMHSSTGRLANHAKLVQFRMDNLPDTISDSYTCSLQHPRTHHLNAAPSKDTSKQIITFNIDVKTDDFNNKY